ncbi:uncharacterized protein LOC143149718 isoform X1 [Ptiloglossa arizonensis]|uniref:uncharacterized protein LOC143149718 isoform X1 n=1 Tax=Ptiloglossa arizonensis TaxID=3350558 RepID=UPI003F9ECE47
MDQYRHGNHHRGIDHHRAVLHRPREVSQTSRGILRFLTHATAALVGLLVFLALDARRLLQPDDIEGQTEGVLHHRLTLKSETRSPLSAIEDCASENKFRRIHFQG